MSPENVDTRLTRVEERVGDQAEQLKFLRPLPAQYAVSEERQAGLRKDLNDAVKSIREEVAAIKTENAIRARERRAMMITLVLAGVGLIGTWGQQLLALRGGR